MLRSFNNMTKEPIIAVCLLEQTELELLGTSFDRAFPVQETPCFGELLRAIDDADRDLWRDKTIRSRLKSTRLPDQPTAIPARLIDGLATLKLPA